jgi:hypothetical protein
LVGDIANGDPAARAEAAVVAKRAATLGYGAIDIGAGKFGVEADLLDTSPESSPEVGTVGIVAITSGTPIEIDHGTPFYH